MVRILNFLLLFIALVGGVFAWRARTEFDVARREYSRLTTKVGRFPIEDPSKIHVRALETDDPLDFVWQVYLPAQFNGSWRTDASGGGDSIIGLSTHEARIEMVRVRFRRIDGKWYAWNKTFNGSGVGSFRQGELLERPDGICASRLGLSGVAVVNADQVASLFELTAKQASDSPDRDEPLFSVRFGSQEAWAKSPSEVP